MSTWNPFVNHRGPYQLQVLRLTPSRKMKWHTETLRGLVAGDDVRSEAYALLADPRDSIISVHVYSVREGQFVMTYTRQAVRS
mgnify:CR=1 FL=1